jgi:protein O-GlcNAc transferase
MSQDITLENHISLIQIELQKNDFKRALDLCLVALDSFPSNPKLLINCGNIFKILGNSSRAVDYYKKSLDYFESKEAYNNLSVIYIESNKNEEAIDMAKRAIEIDPGYEDAFYNLSLAQHRQEDFNNAIKNADICLNMNPNHDKCMLLRYRISQDICDWKSLEHHEEKIDSYIGNGEEHPFLNISRTKNEEINLKVAKTWFVKNITNHSRHKISNIDKKIRVGYICGELRNHPTFHLLKNIFKFHNRIDFNICVFSYNHDDEYLEDIKQNVDEFVDITTKNNLETTTILKSYDLDILIDLSILIPNNRMQALETKPARLIISYLGYPGTSGADFYDYIITDEIVTPESSQKYYTEKFLYMPGCYQINDGVRKFDKLKTKKSDYEISPDTSVLASFNQAFKIDRAIFDCWLKILYTCENTVLWLLEENELMKKNIHDYAEKNDIKKERIIFMKRLNREDHIERLKHVRLALDTRIYNGHTTTTDALQCAVPVICLEGEHFASRVSMSLLKNLKLEDLVASSYEDYVTLSKKLLTNDSYYQQIKNKLTDEGNIKEFYDTEANVKNLEMLLKSVSMN